MHGTDSFDLQIVAHAAANDAGGKYQRIRSRQKEGAEKRITAILSPAQVLALPPFHLGL